MVMCQQVFKLRSFVHTKHTSTGIQCQRSAAEKTRGFRKPIRKCVKQFAKRGLRLKCQKQAVACSLESNITLNRLPLLSVSLLLSSEATLSEVSSVPIRPPFHYWQQGSMNSLIHALAWYIQTHRNTIQYKASR